ncbi:hypothetical protein PGT21_012774 [Puccinia graminis f. sp. tritici]|uniref:Uncharacterized protein n=1 Tax=Puccinia graminis f. sp. tritici TaxID=56615 RepID=A0A5B0LPP7_PUCGR|nr:hypothetical protein PGTUg99_012467 [Puccinia graminis f. sp. tritici]KAA1083961.1 hypothetical protein PGT21_012774 [Puccinia graminis f. sp. tritici]
MDEAVSTAAKEKPPWPHTAGRTLTPSFVFVLVDSHSVPCSLSMSRIVHSHKRFRIKGKARLPFLAPSLPASPASMSQSIGDCLPTPYRPQVYPRPFTQIEMTGTTPMNLDASVDPPASATPAAGHMSLAARIAPAGAVAPPFGRGPPPAYFGPNPTRPSPAHGYRQYNLNGTQGGFQGGFAPGSNFRPRVSVPPFYPNFNQGRRTIIHSPSPGLTVNRTAIDIPFIPPAAPQTRNLNSPIAESVPSSRAASPQASESHTDMVKDFLIPQS